MHCPNCGHSAQPGMARCGHCNFKLPETAYPQASAPNGTKLCWNCRHPNDAHVPHCLQCNAKMEKPIIQAPARTGRPATFTPNTLSHDE